MATVELFSYVDAAADGPADRVYAELAEQAELADRLGYRRLWVTEQHLGARGRAPDSMQLLAYLAGRTERIRLATGVLPAAVRHPALLVESALQLDALSGGRLDLGIGSGSEAGPILDLVGTAVTETADRTLELYEVLAQVRPDGTVTHDGPSFRGEDLAFDPPAARPLLESVWTAAGRTAIELTSRYRTGLLLPRPMPLPARRELARRYREAVPDGRVVHFKAGLVAPTREEALRRAADFVRDYSRRYLDAEVDGPGSAVFADAVTELDFAIGSPEEVADTIQAWLTDFDAEDSVAIQFAGPGVAQEHVLESLELLAPLLPELAGGAG